MNRNGLRGRGALNRVRPRIHRQNRYLPPRPTRATSGYGLFLQEYWTQNNPGGGVTGPDALRRAVADWKALTPDRKRRYNELAEPGRRQYQRAMEQWKATRKALRRPPSAYGLFLKETWELEADSGRTVGEMGRYASGLWAQMTEDARRPYRQLFRNQTAAYNEEIRKLQNGENIDLNWRDKVENPLLDFLNDNDDFLDVDDDDDF